MCKDILDVDTFAKIDSQNLLQLVETLRNLKVTANRPFAMYKTHRNAPFDLLVTVYRKDQAPLYLFIDSKSPAISDFDPKENGEGLHIFYINFANHLASIESIAIAIPDLGAPPLGYSVGVLSIILH